MKSGWTFFVVGLLAALPSHSAPVLVSDKDTVAGIDTAYWSSKGPWFGSNFIRIRNASAHTVKLDSLRFPSDSIVSSGHASRLQLAFAARSLTEGNMREYVNMPLRYQPITLAAGDSIDLGQFAIGTYYPPVKVTATARRYPKNGSITAPLTLFAGADSINFILKAKVMEFQYYGAGIVIRPGGWRPAEAGRTVTVDGRAVPEAGKALRARPAAQILFQ